MDPTDIDAMLPMLPPEWLAELHRWAPTVLAALLLTTALVHASLPLARALHRWAGTTPARWDDAPAARLLAGLEWLAAATGAVLAWVPRLAIGPTRSTRPPSTQAPDETRPS
jgi:hypothetical protein